MGCESCRRAKILELQKKREKGIEDGTISSVSLEVLGIRRSCCRHCKHSTKNPHPKYAKFGGLMAISECRLTRKLLKICLKDPLYACPISLFRSQES
jgi:DNA-directed RNA polymerase subunit N (RpoN/RPB10)